MNLHILFIEDDELDQRALKRTIKNNNLPYDYLLAGSIEEAKQLLAKNKFDIVVSDFNLPDGVGLDIFTSVEDTPIVLVTGCGKEEVAVEAIKAGASDYLVKDPDRSYLKLLPAVVETAIKNFKLEQQYSMLVHALEEVDDSVYITDLKGLIVYVNNAFRKTYQYEENDILGKPHSVVLSSHQDSNNPIDGDKYGKRKSGSEFPISITKSSLKDKTNNPSHYIYITRDISERKAMEESLQSAIEKFSSLLELIGDENAQLKKDQMELTALNLSLQKAFKAILNKTG